jgi:nitronate monooxygenase
VVPSSTEVRIAWAVEMHQMDDGSIETPVTDLVTDWSHKLRLKTPVLNAPMGGVAGGKLASAVTAAGGLGMIGVGSAGSVELLEREAAIPHGDGQRFGIGLLDWAMAGEPRLLEAALAASPVLISVSFGDDWAWAGRVRQAGIVAATQVSNVEEAKRAADSGVDVLIARGAEGGGHGSPMVGTLPLLEGVLDAIALPVLAAGGISSARGLAAVLAAGASGAWIGTAFAACPESLASDATRSTLVAASATDTVVTRVFDIALDYRWPARFPERVIRNEFSERWAGREEALKAHRREVSAFAGARALGADGAVHVDAGQGVGGITESRSAATVVEQLRSGAIDLLQAWAFGPRFDECT